MPYNLPALATKTRPFRVITPTAVQEGEALRLLTPILRTWRDSAVVSLALYAQNASADQLADQDNHAERALAALLIGLKWRTLFERIEAWHRAKWLSSVSAATGVDARWMLAIPFRAGSDAISAALDNSTASATNLAKSLSDEAQNRINQAIAAGRRTGSAASDVARGINAGLAKSRRRADGIAENEIDNAVKAFTDARIAEAGVDMAEWVHTPQRHPRIWHEARDRKLFKADDKVWGELYLPNCKCSKVPAIIKK